MGDIAMFTEWFLRASAQLVVTVFAVVVEVKRTTLPFQALSRRRNLISSRKNRKNAIQRVWETRGRGQRDEM